jgi:hypothetical protein
VNGNAFAPSIPGTQDLVVESVGSDTVAGTASITSFTPTTGAAAGGQSVTITGSGFTGATGVTVGGAAATNFSVVSPTSITFTTPAGTAGARDLVVQSPSGNATSVGGYTYS